HSVDDGTDSVSVLGSSDERFSDLLQIRRVSVQKMQRRNDVVARRRNRLIDLMGNGGAEFPHRYDAVRVRQLHLQLAKLPLAAGNLQGNGSLRGAVRKQFDLLLRKGLFAQSPNSKRSDKLVVSEHGQDEARPKARFSQVHGRSVNLPSTTNFNGKIGDVDRRFASKEATGKAVAFVKHWGRILSQQGTHFDRN